MIALGNDVVDLTEKPRNGAQYYRRLQSYAFTPQEMGQFTILRELPVRLGIGWSIKEAAYKSVVKLIGRQLSKPTDFRFQLVHEASDLVQAHVTYKEIQLRADVRILDSHLHAVSHLSDMEPTYVWGIGDCETDYPSQSAAVRKLALASMITADSIDKHPNGVPHFTKSGEPLANELSLSHHGHRVAFAYQA